MRLFVGSAAAVLLLALTAPARAQVAFTGMTGISPTQVQNVPINSSLPVAAPQTTSTTFGLSGAFAQVPFPGGQPVIGQSTFPNAASLPGSSYLQAFGYQPAPQPSAFGRFRRWLFGG
jgi:hypothetical protein